MLVPTGTFHGCEFSRDGEFDCRCALVNFPLCPKLSLMMNILELSEPD